MANPTKYTAMEFVSTGTPSAPILRVASKISASSTTMTLTDPGLVDSSGVGITEATIIGVKVARGDSKNYVVRYYVPAGGVSANGKVLTNIKALKPDGTEFDTADTSFATEIPKDSVVEVVISAQTMNMLNQFLAGTIGSGADRIFIGDGTTNDQYIGSFIDGTNKLIFKKDYSDGKVYWSDDGASWNYIGTGAGHGTTATIKQHSDVDASVSDSPALGDVVYYDGSKWNKKSGSLEIGSLIYDNISKDVTAQTANVYGIDFKSDGTKMFITGGGVIIYEYALSSPWDLSTASYTTSKNFSAQITTNALAFRIANSGSKLYIGDNVPGIFYQYTLGTPYDISTATYDSKNYNPSEFGSGAAGLQIKSDGSKIYLGSGGTTLYQYTLGTPYDISTASYDSKTKVFSGDGMYLLPDGENVFTNGDGGNTYVKRWFGATPWDITTFSKDNIGFTTTISSTGRLYVKSDFTKIYITEQATGIIKQYSFDKPSTPLIAGEIGVVRDTVNTMYLSTSATTLGWNVIV